MIALGCDHGGYELKLEIKKYLDEQGIAYKDFGCDSLESTDYPIYAKKVAHAILRESLSAGLESVFPLRQISLRGFGRLCAQTASLRKLPAFTTMQISLPWAEE